MFRLSFVYPSYMVGERLFTPKGGNADEKLEIDAWHWTAEDGEVFFVEEVVDCAFE